MKIGLVLAGGGARGAYQIGAIKALKELGLDKYINVLSGTSIGALNAMLFMSGDLEKSISIWNKISKEDILPTEENNLIIRSTLLHLGMNNMNFIKKYMPKIISGGNISRSGLVGIMDEIDFEFIKKSHIICYATCTESIELLPRYFKINDYEEEDIRKILLATSAIPMIYECEKIEEVIYLDGGIVDNVPIQPVYGENCDIIIVVHLARESNIDKRVFPNTYIIEILPTVMEVGLFEGTLDFSVDMSRKRMQIGYDDTMNIIKPIMELTRFIDNSEKEDSKSKLRFKDKIKNLMREV